MYLTDEEKRMLDGEQGPAVRTSMFVITRIGEMFGAKRLVEVHSVHGGIGGGLARFNDIGADMTAKFTEGGAKFKFPTTTNPTHKLPQNWKLWEEWGKIPDKEKKDTLAQERLAARVGVLPNHSCVPYFQGNIPRKGEPCSWGELSAVIFVNSVLGARTNRPAGGITTASAMTGRVAEFGLLLDENRVGEVLVKMEYQPKSIWNYGTVGYVIAKKAFGKVPVIEGLPAWTNANLLKLMGAAQATHGGIALYHCVGITPEASTREEAFKGRKPEYEVSITKKDIDEAVAELNTISADKVDAVIVGCPHPDMGEMRELAELLDGRRVKDNIKFCINAPQYVVQWSRKLGYSKIIKDSGAKIFEGECVGNPSGGKPEFWQNVATYSTKYAIEFPSGPTYLGVVYTDAKGCVELSTTKI